MPRILFTLIIATLALTHLAPTHAMSRTFMRKQERPCIEPLMLYLEQGGQTPLPESKLATTYLRCYRSLSKLQKGKETITHRDANSYTLPRAPIKHSSGAAESMLHCEKEPNQPAKCLIEAVVKHNSSLLETANPALFDLLATTHALQKRNSKTQTSQAL